MCDFFSFVTQPHENGSRRFYYRNWEQRQEDIQSADDSDSHSTICRLYGINEDEVNKYEYNPFTREFLVDQINSSVDDRIQAEDWVSRLNWNRIIEPLIVKDIVNPFALPEVVQVTREHIRWLEEWDSLRRDSVRSLDSARGLVRGLVGDSIWDLVWEPLWDFVWDSVASSVGSWSWDSIWDSIWIFVKAHVLSYFDIEHKYDFSSAVKLWESGLVPSFDGTRWRLHTGKYAAVVYTWTPRYNYERVEND